MSDIIFDPIIIKAGDQLRSYGDISKMQNGLKKKRPLEKTGFIFEQYKNTPNKEYFTAEDKIRDYLTFTIYTEQPECVKAEQMFDMYDNKLKENLQHVIGDDYELCKVKPTCTFPVQKAGQKVIDAGKKKEIIKRKRVNLNIPTVNALYYNNIKFDANNKKIYYDECNKLPKETKEAVRIAKVNKLEAEFMIKQVETDTTIPVTIKFSDIVKKKEFRDLTIYHHLIDSIAEGTKKPNECKSLAEFEQIYGKRVEKHVKDMDELEELMGYNGYRRYFLVPAKTSREIMQKDADVKMGVNIKWEIDSIEIIQVKGTGSFKEYKEKERLSALDDYGDVGETVFNNLAVSQSKTTKSVSEFDDTPSTKPVATPVVTTKPTVATPAVTTKPTVATPAVTTKPTTKPAVVAPQVQLSESDDEGEDGSEYETGDEEN